MGMRTIRNVLFGITGLCFFLVISCIILSSLYTDFSETDHNQVVSEYTEVSMVDFIYTDGSAEALSAAKLIAEFVKVLPSELTGGFSDGWKIIVSENVMEHVQDSSQNASTYAGATLWKQRLILIKSNEDPALASRVFVHELGHYFDMSYGFCSKSPEFQDLYEQHKDTFCVFDKSVPESYPRSSAQELFAEAFKEYVLYPKALEADAPEIKNYLDVVYQEAVENRSPIHILKNHLIALYRLKKT